MSEIDCVAETAPCRCLDAPLLDLLSSKYTPEVICVVGAHGTVRFGDIEAHLPAASSSTLSRRLDALVEADLIERERYDEIPPRVEYSLTPDGEELGERLEPLVTWLADRDG